ncbi:hypothetical protein [Actinokineospora sp. NBRC 105648]|nr:hypothetical protein [Actinokineospora sp. NBRC 105648]GLZ41432.1 hypothetical protein Acsp05_50560 [Actinokineospora sp. NBRC 105648]
MVLGAAASGTFLWQSGYSALVALLIGLPIGGLGYLAAVLAAGWEKR